MRIGRPLEGRIKLSFDTLRSPLRSPLNKCRSHSFHSHHKKLETSPHYFNEVDSEVHSSILWLAEHYLLFEITASQRHTEEVILKDF